MTKLPEIKPCQFCGKEDLAVNTGDYIFIECKSCGAQGPIVERNGSISMLCSYALLTQVEGAISRWNERKEIT